MVIVIRNRQVVHAYAFDGSIFFLLKLFLFKDVISSCFFWLRIILSLFHLRIHVSYLFVHIGDFVVVSALCCRLLLLRCGTIDVVHNFHHVVYVNNLICFACVWRPSLKPTILQLYLLNGACS